MGLRRFSIGVMVLLAFVASVEATPRTVTKTGTNSGNCSVSACLTIAYAATQMAAADTLTIHAGTYSEGLVYNEFPEGTDDAHHTIVQAAAGETVIINGHESNNFTASIAGSFKTFSGLIFDAVNATNAVGIFLWGTAPDIANHILLQDIEIKNASGGTSACLTAGGNGSEVNHVTMNRLTVHDCTGGTPTTHCIYLHMHDSAVTNSTLYNCGGFGVQQYTGVALVGLDNNVIAGNRISAVSTDGAGGWGGIYVGMSDSALVYNNVLFNAGGAGTCIIINASTNPTVSNNTCDRFTAAAGISGFLREDTSGADISATAQNNIGWNNGPLNTIVGSAWTQDHNICGSGCASSSDPKFVNAAAGNFHLAAGSPAIGAGANLYSTFTNDLSGAARPSMGPWDLGAYVFPITINFRKTLSPIGGKVGQRQPERD